MIKHQIFKEIKKLVNDNMILTDAIEVASFRWRNEKYQPSIIKPKFELDVYRISTISFNEIASNEQKLELDELIKEANPTLTWQEWLHRRKRNWANKRYTNLSSEEKKEYNRKTKEYKEARSSTPTTIERKRQTGKEYRKKKKAEFAKLSKQEKQKILDKKRARARKRYANLSPEEKKEHSRKTDEARKKRQEAGRHVAWYNKLSQKEKDIYNKKGYKKRKQAFENSSPELIEKERIRLLELSRNYRAKMTPEEKAIFNKKAKLRMRDKLASMTPKEKKKLYKKRKAKETPEQRERRLILGRKESMTPERLAKKKECNKKYRENWTAEERARHLAKKKETAKQRFANMSKKDQEAFKKNRNEKWKLWWDSLPEDKKKHYRRNKRNP